MDNFISIEEIKEELNRRNWTQRMLAEKIGKNETYVSDILSGRAKLTASNAKHIALLFESSKTVFFAYAVDIPDNTCRSWVPGFENLTPRQQVEAVKAVVTETLKKLAKNGYAALTEEDRQAMVDVLPLAHANTQQAVSAAMAPPPSYGEAQEPFA